MSTDIRIVNIYSIIGMGYPAFSQGQGTSSATGSPSTFQTVSYPAQVQHPTPFCAHTGWLDDSV